MPRKSYEESISELKNTSFKYSSHPLLAPETYISIQNKWFLSLVLNHMIKHDIDKLGKNKPHYIEELGIIHKIISPFSIIKTIQNKLILIHSNSEWINADAENISTGEILT